MSKQKNIISEKAAVQLLNRLFSDTNKDELTLEQVYIAAGRGEIDAVTNRNWLNSVITKLRNYKFIETIDKFENSRTKVDKIRLTIAGKAALGWTVDDIHTPPSLRPISTSMTYNDLAKAVAAFRNENSDFDVIFEVKLKEVK